MGSKKFKELPLSDNFMFAEVMRDRHICQQFLEKLLGKKLSKISFTNKEQDLKEVPHFRGVRLDIIAVAEDGTQYNIEMQRANKGNLERRIRFYWGMMDRKSLEESVDFKMLPNSYVIFVCDFDYFGQGLARYETSFSIGDGTVQVPFNDGQKAIVLNSKYSKRNADKSILEFLDIIREKKDECGGKSPLVGKIKQKMQNIRFDPEKEAEYMNLAQLLRETKNEGVDEGREIGREEGRVEGRVEGRAEGLTIAIMALRDDFPPEKLAKKFNVDLSFVEKVLEEN